MNQGKSLKKYLDSKKVDKSELAKRLDVSRATLYNIFSAEIIPNDYLEPLERIVGFTVEKPAEIEQKNGNILHVPLHSWGGFLIGYENKAFLDTLEPWSMPGIEGLHYSFPAKGMSLWKPGDERSIKPGDTLIARPEQTHQTMTKGFVYVLVTVDGLIHKVFDHIDNQQAHFISLNTEYEGEVIKVKAIKMVLLLVRIVKNPYT